MRLKVLGHLGHWNREPEGLGRGLGFAASPFERRLVLLPGFVEAFAGSCCMPVPGPAAAATSILMDLTWAPGRREWTWTWPLARSRSLIE